MLTQDTVLEFLIDEIKEEHHCLMMVLYFLKYTPGFHLTGSRSFGTNGPDSDYDFFVQEDPYIMDSLRDLGFSYEINSRYTDEGGYDDSSVLYVFKYVHKDVQIHIQVIKRGWFERKLSAQRKIEELHRLLPARVKNMTKQEMKEVWRRVILAV